MPDLLKTEKVNFEGGDPSRPRRDLWAYAVAAKKYALIERGHAGAGRIVALSASGEDGALEVGEDNIVDRRSHGLGYLRKPVDPRRDPDGTDWVTEAWAFTIAAESGERPPSPAWFARPQMSQNATVSTPRQLMAFRAWNAGRTAADAVKPFNFLNRVFIDDLELPSRLRGLVLAAPYDDEPETWLTANYYAINTPGSTTFRITTERVDPEVGDDGSGRVRVHDYGDLVWSLPLHPESKSLGPDGRVCGPGTRGLLSRRSVEIGDVVHVGKESTQLGGDGLEGAWRRVKVYREPGPDEWTATLLPLLQATSTAEVAGALGVDRSTVKRWKTGARPHQRMLVAPGAAPRRLRLASVWAPIQRPLSAAAR